MIPGTDITWGQVIQLAVGIITLITLILSGQAARHGRSAVRSIRRLVASVGQLPDGQEHRSGQTLTAQVDRLASEWEWFREKYKRDQDNLRAQQLYQQAGQRNDEPPVRDGIENPAQTRRH